MANNCFTSYRFYGERAEELYNDIQKVQDNHKDDIPTWCKYVATDILGYTEEQIEKGSIYVRGQIFLLDACQDVCSIDTDTAWTPCGQLFRELAEKYELNVYWMADERGCCGIWSNDIDGCVWDWKYVVYDSNSGDEENFADDEQALEWINNRSDKQYSSVTDAMEDDNDFCITEVEYGEWKE